MPLSLKLWPARAPGTLGKASSARPALIHYTPARARSGAPAMVILPGGSYRFHAKHEGAGYAHWLVKQGYHAFVLNYRLGSSGYRHPVMLSDAVRAIRFVRHHAARWRIAHDKIGIMGSSAGGHLAALLATVRKGEPLLIGDAIDRESPHPNLVVLCYPVITMGPLAHKESRRQFLGARPASKLCRQVSAEYRVTPQTPPCFIWHTVTDDAVSVTNSLLFACALRRNSVSFEMHLYPEGGHGLGLGQGHAWTHACQHWLRSHFRTWRSQTQL